MIPISKAELDYCLRNEVPLPVTSPIERLRLMSAFRSGHFLYHSRCAKTGRQILSYIPPDRGITVYDVKAWLDEDWSATSYGQDYDFSRPFFEQFGELLRKVPLPNLTGTHASLENCPYCNMITAAKNCYLVFSAQQIEDCLFGRFLYFSKEVVDSFFIRRSELCYGSVDLQSCYNVHFSEHCENCSDSLFLSACRSCTNCYQCVNLLNKKFCWQNRQLSESEWHKRRSEIDLADGSVVERERQDFARFIAQQPVRCIQGISYENSSGNYLNQVADCEECFLVSEADSLDHCIWVNKGSSCIFTIGFGGDSELLYNCTQVGNRAYNIKFSLQCRQMVRDLEYCLLVEANSHDCFGCISVRNGQYCILNKQYSAEEYFSLLPKVKEHMQKTGEYGQFFPIALSPFTYDESDASLFFPIERAEAVEMGFRWSDSGSQVVATDFPTVPVKLPSEGDEVLNQTYRCEVTGKGYRIQRKELEFLRKLNFALPRIAPFERIRRAGKFLEWRPVVEVNCATCGRTCRTVYDPTARKICCEACYQELLLEAALN